MIPDDIIHSIFYLFFKTPSLFINIIFSNIHTIVSSCLLEVGAELAVATVSTAATFENSWEGCCEGTKKENVAPAEYLNAWPIKWMLHHSV